MRKNPHIEFNLEKLQHNVTTIYNMCAAKGNDIIFYFNIFSTV